jgi:hypothetical protein
LLLNCQKQFILARNILAFSLVISIAPSRAAPSDLQIPVFGETIPSYRKIELGENRVLRGTESRYVTYTHKVFIAVQLVRDATFWRVIFLHTAQRSTRWQIMLSVSEKSARREIKIEIKRKLM